MQKISLILPFIIGLLSVSLTVFLPGYIRPHLPALIAGQNTIVRGTVVLKEKKGDSLLLAVNTPQGALLASFTAKANDIDILIGENDAVEFALHRYDPFLENPRITRVVKEQRMVSSGAKGIISEYQD